jgi:hypothetical protein
MPPPARRSASHMDWLKRAVKNDAKPSPDEQKAYGSIGGGEPDFRRSKESRKRWPAVTYTAKRALSKPLVFAGYGLTGRGKSQ